MRYVLPVAMIFILAGCSVSPPKPPMPEGEYRPVNRPATPTKQPVFNFTYEGDILGALPALQEVAAIHVMPSSGTPTPIHVRLQLQGTTLEKALRALANEAGDTADVVWNTTRHKSGNWVFIRFRETSDIQKGMQ